MKQKTDGRGRFEASLRNLEQSLEYLKKAKEEQVYAAAIAKNFETCLEYAWKYLKQRATDEGVEVYSPKEAIKQAGRLGIVDDVEKWLSFLEVRNLAVHDYLGLSDDEYLKAIQAFLPEAKKLLR